MQGHIIATRREIESVFGKPNYETDDTSDKVTTEWEILFDDETVATVYDWKRYELGAPTMDERTTWNIGGKSYAAIERIEDSMLARA